ncbi:MAG TPA: response regulator [Burkholderiaceae bacterium]|nr:response regulator [Burkholderiaceae bacterium]
MSQATPPTVFVVDDDAAVRDSIAELVESVGLRCETHASAPAFLQAFDPERPGCLVLDVRMAEMSGLALQERLNTLRARIPVIMLTGHGDVPMAVQALKAGAVDFLQKPYREQALLDSIHAALALDAAERRAHAGADAFARRLATLTPREREVFDQLLAGRTSKEIAATLDISPRTAEVHRRSLLHKFGVGSAKELIPLSASAGVLRT